MDDQISTDSAGKVSSPQGAEKAEKSAADLAIQARNSVAERAASALREAFGDKRILPIHHAVFSNDLPRVAQILREDPSQASCVCEAPLHDKLTPLHLAAKQQNPEIARLLLANGADPSSRGPDGATPLVYSCGSESAEMVRLLLEHGSDVNAATDYGWKPIRSCRPLSDRREPSGAKSPLDVLLEYGADVSIEDAACLNMVEKLRELLDANPHHDLNQSVEPAEGDEAEEPPVQRTTLLHEVACHDQPEVVRILLEHGADPTIRDYDRKTPLHLAAKCNQRRVAKVLLEGGAGSLVAGQDAYWLFNLCHAVSRWRGPENETVAALLVQYGGKPDLHQALDLGFTAAARGMLNADPDCVQTFNQRDDGSNWLLEECTAMLHGLTDAAIPDDWQNRDHEKRSEVLAAITQANLDIFEAIARCNVRHVVHYWRLNGFICSGDWPLIQLLADHGAQIHEIEHETQMPHERDMCQMACEQSPDVAALFRKMGARFPERTERSPH